MRQCHAKYHDLLCDWTVGLSLAPAWWFGVLPGHTTIAIHPSTACPAPCCTCIVRLGRKGVPTKQAFSLAGCTMYAHGCFSIPLVVPGWAPWVVAQVPLCAEQPAVQVVLGHLHRVERHAEGHHPSIPSSMVIGGTWFGKHVQQPCCSACACMPFVNMGGGDGST